MRQLPRVAARLGLAVAHERHALRHVAGRQVVEQDAVGQLAGQAQHAGVERGQHQLGPAVAEAHGQLRPAELVERAVVADVLAGQQLAAAASRYSRMRARGRSP